MKKHKYERIFVFKRYPHNILQGFSRFPMLTSFPKVTMYVPKYELYMNLEIHVSPTTYTH